MSQVEVFVPVCSLKHSVQVRVSGSGGVRKRAWSWVHCSSTEVGLRAWKVPGLEDPAAFGV